MRPVSLVATVAAALGGTSVLAAPPTVPGDLRVEVYSGTAAELFWSRSSDPDGFVRGYEIRRDGELLDTRDALSFFTDSLSDGQASAFTVTAVDFDGERSAPASVGVVGGDRTGTIGAASANRPPPPANLRARTYSSTSAELFWDRSERPGLSYEVLLGRRVIDRSEGTSAFFSDFGLRGGQTFNVVAVDADGRRSEEAFVFVSDVPGGGGPNPRPPAGGTAPGAPTSLFADLYSSSAGEVFWDRVPGANLSYEVSLDGEVVSTTTGTSYFAGDVPGLDGTRVEVVAIGPDGTRSAASSTTIGSGGTANPDPVPNPGAGAPAPANARIAVYSDTVAEVFWDRAPASANVVETRIVRNGREVGATRGTSYFDQDRIPGRSYTYKLVAVARGGRPSPPSTVTDGSVSGAGERQELPTDVAGRLDTVFALANGEAFEPLLAFLDRLDALWADGRTPIGAALDPDFPRAGPREVFGCPDGGTFAVALGAVSGVGGFSSTIADGCTVGGRTFDGTFFEQASAGRGSNLSSSDTSVRNYRMFDADTGVVVTMASGEVGEFEPAARDGGPFIPTRWIARELSVTGGGVDYSAANQVTIFPGIESLDPAETIGLTVTIEGLEYASSDGVTVETDAAFRRAEADRRFAVGSLTIAGSGRVETLDADAGDPSSFLLTVEEGDATTSYTVPWSSRFNFERPVADDAAF